MRNKLTLAAVSAVALGFATFAAPVNAAIICDDEECKPAIILPSPDLFGSDDDCGCED